MKVYWTMANRQKIDIDEMSINHLRNALKMVVRAMEAKKNSIAEPCPKCNGAKEILWGKCDMWGIVTDVIPCPKCQPQ